MFVDGVVDVLLFRGFSKKTAWVKLKWLFFLYPISLLCLLFGVVYLICLIPIVWTTKKQK